MVHTTVDGTFRQTNLTNESPEYLAKREELRLAEIELMQALGGQETHFAKGVHEREYVFFTNIFAQQARVGTRGARMAFAVIEDAIAGHDDVGIGNANAYHFFGNAMNGNHAALFAITDKGFGC